MPRPVSDPIVVRRRATRAPFAGMPADPHTSIVDDLGATQQRLVKLNPPSFLERAVVLNRTGIDGLDVELNPATDGTLFVVLRRR